MEKEFFYGYVDNKIYCIFQDIISLEEALYGNSGGEN